MSSYAYSSKEQADADGHLGRPRRLLALESVLCALALTAALAGFPAVSHKLEQTIRSGASPAAPGCASAGRQSAASAASQPFGWYTRYTLRLDIGGEQSVVVMAPPGGLQFTVRDMTGDKVPNDVIVTPALLQWPLTVLVNDGNNHFTVAISAKLPDTSASGQDRASPTPGSADFTALVSPGFKHHARSNRGGALLPLRREEPLSATMTFSAPPDAITSNSARAPPASATNL